MGTTYVAPHPGSVIPHSFSNRSSSQPFRDTLRPPAALVPGTGVLRSQRPSVSDWAGGPDADDDSASPTSSEIQLDPYHGSMRSQRGRNTEPAKETPPTGMDFMTSALEAKDENSRR